MTPAISVVVLTLNEARNIVDCLQSLGTLADVHVLDSGSTDATVELATGLGAQVGFNRFESFAQQRNHAHDALALRHDWVLHLDADERLTPALRAEIGAAVAADDGTLAGYYLAERTLLDGRWLRRAGQYPRHQARLVHRRRMRFVDHGHGQREASSLPFGTLREPYDHLAFSHGVEAWLRKHAGYATREAEQYLREAPATGAALQRLLFGRGIERRRAAKALAFGLPFRPTLRWLQILLWNRGVLDGRPGFTYARMMKTFQMMIDLSLAEQRATRAGRTAAARPAAAADALGPAGSR